MTERGFGAMDDEKQKEIARKGGQASHGGKGQDSQSKKQGGSSERGFAAMDEEEQREIASKGERRPMKKELLMSFPVKKLVKQEERATQSNGPAQYAR